jgi:hypothetical protein
MLAAGTTFSGVRCELQSDSSPKLQAGQDPARVSNGAGGASHGRAACCVFNVGLAFCNMCQKKQT